MIDDHFDAPEDRDTYVHRTGRPGRAGASGVAASFVLPDQHRDMHKIAKDLGLHQEFADGPGFEHGEHASRQHPGNGGASRNGKSRNGSKPRTYSARPSRNRRRGRR